MNFHSNRNQRNASFRFSTYLFFFREKKEMKFDFPSSQSNRKFFTFILIYAWFVLIQSRSLTQCDERNKWSAASETNILSTSEEEEENNRNKHQWTTGRIKSRFVYFFDSVMPVCTCKTLLMHDPVPLKPRNGAYIHLHFAAREKEEKLVKMDQQLKCSFC